MSAELGWAVKNGDLDKVKDFIELKVSFILKSIGEEKHSLYI